jgi:hypothetical protein
MNVKRLAAGAAVVTILSVGSAFAKPATVTADVNLRKGPGTDNEVITLIPKGSMVEVGLCTNGWCQVTFEGQDGYSITTNLGLGGARPAVRRPPPPPPGVAEGEEYPPPPGAYAPPPGAYVQPPGVVYAPPPAYVYGPGVYYGYGPAYRPWGWGGGWGWRRRW